MNPHLTPLLLAYDRTSKPAFAASGAGGGSGAGLIATAISAGYAFGIGHVGAPDAGQLLNPAPLMAALRAGWTWGEAVAVSAPTLNSTWRVIGDPLASLPLPKAGWDVLGPVSRLEELDPHQPAVALRDDERSAALDASLHPQSPDPVVYLVRHVDDLGRSEAGSTVIRVAKHDSVAATAPLSPIWPDADGWPVLIEDNLLVPQLLWDRPAHQAAVAQVELLIQDANGETSGGTSGGVVTVLPHQRAIRFELALPTPSQTPIQLQWRITSDDGVTIHTPRSQTIKPTPTATTPLQLN